MKKLTNNYSYEIVDDEVIFYVGTGEQIDFEIPHVLNNVYIANVFSLQMLEDINCTLSIEEMDSDVFNDIKPYLKSAIGHQDTAKVLGVEMNRVNVTLNSGDILIVAQLSGGRLSEGVMALTDGCLFKYLWIEVD